MNSSGQSLDLDFDTLRCLDISLAEKLASFSRWENSNFPEFGVLYRELVERLTSSSAGENALKTGSSVPSIILPDADGHLIDVPKLLSSGPLVISFNRGYWCPYCKLELLALANIYPQIQELGAQVISITPQRAPATNKLAETCDLPFSILCDLDNSYALLCGLMMSQGSDIVEALSNFGVDLGSDQGSKGGFLPIPATYVINPEGLVVAHYIHPDFRTRMVPEDILKALQLINPDSLP